MKLHNIYIYLWVSTVVEWWKCVFRHTKSLGSIQMSQILWGLLVIPAIIMKSVQEFCSYAYRRYQKLFSTQLMRKRANVSMIKFGK